MIAVPYCNRKDCFGICNDNGYSACKALSTTYGREYCKFYKTKKQFDEERKRIDMKNQNGDLHIIRTSSGLMYYS